MAISLNSPKYADVNSLAYQMHKKQQDRKKRRASIPEAITRYFRRNLGTTDYYSHAAVTVDRIVMDVLPNAGNGNTGLPTGAPAVTDNVLQTIDFVYSGTISELCKNGAAYFSGIMANVKYYLGGQQIHGYDIKSNSNTIPDTIGSNDITIINPNPEDWQPYTQQENGDWLAAEGIDQPIDLNTRWVATAAGLILSSKSFSTTTAGGIYYDAIQPGRTYRIASNFSGDIDSLQMKNSLGLGSGANIISDVVSGDTLVGYLAVDRGLYLRNLASSSEILVNNVSVREVLKVA